MSGTEGNLHPPEGDMVVNTTCDNSSHQQQPKDVDDKKDNVDTVESALVSSGDIITRCDNNDEIDHHINDNESRDNVLDHGVDTQAGIVINVESHLSTEDCPPKSIVNDTENKNKSKDGKFINKFNVNNSNHDFDESKDTSVSFHNGSDPSFNHNSRRGGGRLLPIDRNLKNGKSIVKIEKSIPSIASVMIGSESRSHTLTHGSITPDSDVQSHPGLSPSQSINSDIDSSALDVGIIDSSDMSHELGLDYDTIGDLDQDDDSGDPNKVLIKLLTTLSKFSGFNQKYQDENESEKNDGSATEKEDEDVTESEDTEREDPQRLQPEDDDEDQDEDEDVLVIDNEKGFRNENDSTVKHNKTLKDTTNLNEKDKFEIFDVVAEPNNKNNESLNFSEIHKLENLNIKEPESDESKNEEDIVKRESDFGTLNQVANRSNQPTAIAPTDPKKILSTTTIPQYLFDSDPKPEFPKLESKPPLDESDQGYDIPDTQNHRESRIETSNILKDTSEFATSTSWKPTSTTSQEASRASIQTESSKENDDCFSATDHSLFTTVAPSTKSKLKAYSTTAPNDSEDSMKGNDKNSVDNHTLNSLRQSRISRDDQSLNQFSKIKIPGSYSDSFPTADRRPSAASTARIPGAFKHNEVHSNLLLGTSSATAVSETDSIFKYYPSNIGGSSSLYSDQNLNTDADESMYYDTQDNLTVTSETISDTTTFTALDYTATKDSDFEMNIVGRTVLEKSVVKNLDNFVFDKGILSTRGENFHSNSHLRKLQSLKLKVADKLQKVFEIDDYDYFQGNIVAWLVKDVLLQGNLYLTSECLMYFAFLPKPCNFKESSYTKIDDSEQIFQKGALGMKTANYGETMFKSVTTHRYWAVLRMDTFSVYSSSTDLYFPKIIIDLRTCLRAEIIEDEKPIKPKSGTQSRPDSCDCMSPITGILSPKKVGSSSGESSDYEDENENQVSATADNPEQLQDGIWFKLTTDKKTFKFYADNYYTARHWCNNLTKLIFRLQNSNASQEVLMKIPMKNITKISKSLVLDTPGSEYVEDSSKSNGLYIEYVSTDENMNSRAASPNELKTKQEKNQLALEQITFVFFTDTKKFFNKLTKVLRAYKEIEDRKRKEEERKNPSKTNRLKILSRSKENSIESQYARSMSTLLPSSMPNHIFDQFVAVNSHLQNEFSSSPASTTEIKKSSTLRKIGKSLNPRSILSRGKSETPSSFANTSVYQKNSNLSLLSDDILLNEFSISFPRPLSVSTLRNLQMEFQITKKDPRIAEYLYSTDVSQNEKSIELDNPLGLEDPVELQKTSTFRSIGKSINVFSSLSNLFTSNPSHYYQDEMNDPYYVSDEEERAAALKHYIQHFAVKNPVLLASYYVCLQRTGLPIYGKLYFGQEEICFRSLLPGVSTKMILPLNNVEMITKAGGIKLPYYALRIIMHGADECFLEFGSQAARDDCENVGLAQLLKLHNNENWIPEAYDWGPNHSVCRPKVDDKIEDEDEENSISTDLILAQNRIANARVRLFEDKLHFASGVDIPIILEDSPFFKTEVRPSVPYNFVLLTIGSRGDVQPYIALGKELLKEGHNVTIATHSEFEGWIRKHGLKFKVIAGNPAELMSLMVSHGSVSVGFIKEAASKFRGWILELLHTSWEACQGCDIIIESPSAMCGIHIAEALGVPYMRAFTMPWTKTKAYPHAFIVPDQKRGGSYNYLTHVMFETVLWKGISSQVNKWRVNELDLPKTNLLRMQQYKVPFLYNVSPSVLPPAVDFPDWVSVTGYWFLDEGSADDYNPPKELVEFLDCAKEDGKRVVYIGFGSIVVQDAKAMTRAVVDAVLDADVRCILNKGWSDRLSKQEDIPEVELPPEIYNSGSIPHDWLFPRIDAAVHHGGSGTTGACLRAGLPIVIKPFFGDQFFYAMRIEDSGLGVGLKKLNSKSLSKAIKTVTSDVKMIEKVRKISVNIKKDNGKLRAIEQIYCNLVYAQNLITSKQAYNENYKKHNPDFKTISEPVTPSEDIDDMFEEDLNKLKTSPRESEASTLR